MNNYYSKLTVNDLVLPRCNSPQSEYISQLAFESRFPAGGVEERGGMCQGTAHKTAPAIDRQVSPPRWSLVNANSMRVARNNARSRSMNKLPTPQKQRTNHKCSELVEREVLILLLYNLLHIHTSSTPFLLT